MCTLEEQLSRRDEARWGSLTGAGKWKQGRHRKQPKEAGGLKETEACGYLMFTVNPTTKTADTAVLYSASSVCWTTVNML